MITDIFTVLWKEAKELFLQSPRFRGGWMGMIIFVGVFGILIPLQSGSGWVATPQAVIVYAWLPYILVNGIVADAFAGERERHTLETLLASRLSDRAILFGKIAGAMLYGEGITLITLLVGLLVTNFIHWEGQLILFPLPILGGILVTSLLFAALAAGLGVLVSLRAATVRQAQQTLSVTIFIFIIPLVALPLLPESVQVAVATFLSSADFATIATVVIVALLVIDLALFGLALARFRRARLILD